MFILLYKFMKKHICEIKYRIEQYF